MAGETLITLILPEDIWYNIRTKHICTRDEIREDKEKCPTVHVLAIPAA